MFCGGLQSKQTVTTFRLRMIGCAINLLGSANCFWPVQGVCSVWGDGFSVGGKIGDPLRPRS